MAENGGVGYMFGAPPGNVKDAIDTILVAWKKVDDERVNWSLEKAQLESKVKALQDSIEMHKKVEKELVQKIKFLENSLTKKSSNVLSGQENLRRNGRSIDLKTFRKAKWRTLPTYLPKARMTAESVREIMADLMSSSKDKIILEPSVKKTGIPIAADDTVIQEVDEDDNGTNLDIKIENEVQDPANNKESIKDQGGAVITSGYTKLRELETKSQHKWKGMSHLRSHLDGVRSVSFHPKLPLLVSGAEDGTAKLWDMEKLIKKKKASKKQEPVYTFRGHQGMVTSTAATEKLVVSAGVDGKVFLYGYPTKKQTQYTPYGTMSPFTLNCFEHDEAVWSVCTGGKLVFAACADGSVTAWEANFDAQKKYKSVYAAASSIPTSVTMSPTGSQLYVSHVSGEVIVYDIETAKAVSVLESRSKAHAMQIVSHPFLELAVTANVDGSYQLFDSAAGKCVDMKQNAHTDAVTSVSIDTNGVAMASASHDQSIRVWDLRNLGITIDMDPNQHRKKYDEAIHCVAHHRQSPLLASGGADSVVKVFLGE